MTRISSEEYFINVNNGKPHIYDFPSETCIFPYQDEEIDMRDITFALKNEYMPVTINENYETRLITRNDPEWIAFAKEYKKECNYICQVSNFNLSKIRQLAFEIFSIPKNKTWINNGLTIHHTSNSVDYDCRDKSKLIVVNRAIHMILHRYDKLISLMPNLAYDYRLWYEIGSFVNTDKNEFPWRLITDVVMEK